VIGLTIPGCGVLRSGFKVMILGLRLPLGLLGLPFVMLGLLIGLLPVKVLSRRGGN